MIPQQPPPPRDRRLLMAAAALGGVLIGLVVMRLFSGGGGDVAVGAPPQATPVPTQTTTTVALPVLSAETAAALARARDPFGQIVTVGDAAQAGQGSEATQGPAAAPAPAPAPAVQATPATPRAPAPTTTAPPPPPAPPAPVIQPPPAGPTLPAAQVPPPPLTPNTVSGRVGPIAVAGVPVNVCVDNGIRHCTLTAPATMVSLSVSATLEPAAVTVPTVVPAACSNGQGAALLVNTGSAGTVIYVSATVTVNGSPSIVAFGLPAPTTNQSVMISACVAPGVGVPSAGAAMPPTTGGLVDGLLQALLGLLGTALVAGPPGAPPTLLGPLLS